MMTSHRRRTLMAVIAIAVLASACGGSDESSTATTASGSVGTSSTAAPGSSVATTSAPSASAGPGACKYVTTPEASALAASAVKPGVTRSLNSGPVTFEYCDYIFDPGNAPGVTVAVADLGSSGPSLFDQFRQSKATADEFQAVPGIGD